MNKPFTTYNGGKESDGTYQKIINLMPPHDIYIEPFLGNGAILRRKKRALLANIGIDLDAAVIRRWNNIDLPAGITLINTDAISWLENFIVPGGILKKMGASCLIYLDPPYPKNTRKNQKNLYACEMDIPGHTKLLNVIRRLPNQVIISSYPNELYDKALSDWSTIEFTATTRAGTATEKVWFNYPEPKELHDYQYIGNDYREREQLKGIVTRNVDKFKRLPEIQRNAIINQLKNESLI